MGKIKKLEELTFTSELRKQETLHVKGGAVGVECHFSTVLSGSWPQENKKPAGDCSCGCSGCLWEDGGTGFAVGMSVTNTDGVQCNFQAIGG